MTSIHFDLNNKLTTSIRLLSALRCSFFFFHIKEGAYDCKSLIVTDRPFALSPVQYTLDYFYFIIIVFFLYRFIFHSTVYYAFTYLGFYFFFQMNE